MKYGWKIGFRFSLFGIIRIVWMETEHARRKIAVGRQDSLSSATRHTRAKRSTT
jgi:hypothetical protein